MSISRQTEKGLVTNWVKQAVSFYDRAGREISMAEFTNPHGQFVRDSLYIFVIDLDGKVLAHPLNERYTGKDFLHFRDSDGRFFILKVLENAKRNGNGFTTYKWYNPEAGKEMLKTIYYEEVDGMVFCSGFYSREENCPDFIANSMIWDHEQLF